jgi:hypothetical protein
VSDFVRISKGKASFIYSDNMKDLLKRGPSVVKRASHVEPVGVESGEWRGWEAKMEDGQVLGPFDSREEALSAERAYLEEKMFR